MCPDCCSRERVSLAQKCLENTQRKVAGFQNSTVYLQWGGWERGELIFQTAHGCQVYRPWVMPGERELRAFPAHLLPQAHWGPRFLSGADSVPSCCMGNVLSGMGFLRPGRPAQHHHVAQFSPIRGCLGLKILASCFGACHSGAAVTAQMGLCLWHL